MWKKSTMVYKYTFHSSSLDDFEIEMFLKGEINPVKNKSCCYRSDYKDFKINGGCITFDKGCIWIASKHKLMNKLQEKLDLLSLIKKYQDLLR